jgi:hypothetical protein
MVQAAYTSTAWSKLVEQPEHRIEALKPVIEKLGAKFSCGTTPSANTTWSCSSRWHIEDNLTLRNSSTWWPNEETRNEERRLVRRG